ncbi:cytochrome B [Pseudomonas agarici]|uniref:Cytochrome B n=1 Tax=Pseudomonas agarici TaxID=46677 RepID=A0A0X1SVT5_PSEAA|nr:cytochrome b [Pseudomonas agarici]AMB84042.1 cytochrome B [Pseudomonas agarici]NWB91326.1 cytochrome b [Pseudomonas agarici]NWC08094.1 cytochrome b [Pseudomonas agarici]SEL18397.1 Cytochrome b561 [Pseudomonas agarici]
MQLRNSSSRYGAISMLLHWGVALMVFGLFALGLWMVGLDYYSEWRKAAPDLHRSIGLSLFAVMVLRLIWRFISPPPPAPSHHGRLTRVSAKLAHGVLYLALFTLMFSGYLISTAEGVGITVFKLFDVPAWISSIPDQANVAGTVHLYLAWTVVIFAGLHGLAALKHHFIDRDATLTRMLGREA